MTRVRHRADPFERPVVDRDVHPEKVAAAWARHVAAGDVPAAVALCAPTVVLHTSTGDLTGVRHVSGALESWPYAGTRLDPVDVVGEADLGTTRMTWPGWGPDRTVVAHVEHGEIVDLRIDGVPVGAREPPDQLAVEISTAGTVTDQAKQYAVEKVQHVDRSCHRPGAVRPGQAAPPR